MGCSVWCLHHPAHCSSGGTSTSVLRRQMKRTELRHTFSGLWNKILTVISFYAPILPQRFANLYKVSPRGRMERSRLNLRTQNILFLRWKASCKQEFRSAANKRFDNVFITANLIPVVSTPNCTKIFHYCYYIPTVHRGRIVAIVEVVVCGIKHGFGRLTK